jgi:hypothetical protein
LDDQVGAQEGTAGVVQQPSEDRRRVRERHVRHDAERLVREPKLECVAGDDPDGVRPRETVAQPLDENRIELDRDDTSGTPGELVREHAGAGTDLDDEIAACDAGIPDEVSGEARDEEVLTACGA